ncbi:hypothetical protein [Lactobacillus gigeriorum]|uniref:Conserved domain protein n=2 Tax=Lactobacillus gigeriorum DSM 23908 = CRBIP 24.85 TaxID=1423751 RepID=I7LF51_9LACO|nr:hypothetical protein [Lactobacillus gigeriorum]CCI86353.1 Conserved domain protein [Lactobacillus gigeriorum DSM 23908 = CRBIP 24.85]
MIHVLASYLAFPLILFAINCFYMRHDRKALWRRTISIIILLLLGFTYVYFFLPSRNLLSIIGSNFIWTIIYLLLDGLVSIRGLLTEKLKFKLNGRHSKEPSPEPAKQKRLAPKWIALVLLLLALVSVGGQVYSFMSVKPTWNSIQKKFSKSTQAPTFKKGETPIALAPKTVINRVKKASSDIPNSQYFSISKNVQAQFYQGKPVYVIPIEYNGFFEMLKAGEIPGYFIIDATKQNATPHFVKMPYKYATSAYFNTDAERQIYRHAANWLSLDDPQLEINDEGKPFWVETIYKSEFLSHRVNYQKLYVAVMDAQTGEVKKYPLTNLPKFIDEGITTGIANQINWDFGIYRYGFWNRYFGKTGVMKPTGNGVENGVTSVFNENGTISYFSDFTTDKTGSDSALGYSMINARTGQLTFYTANNIMDSTGAKNNADQDYKAQQWKANMPILYNINGRSTWVMTILDSTSAIRGYYYLDASNQSIYGNGTNPNSALERFRQALVNSGAVAQNTPGSKWQKRSGIVDRVAILADSHRVMFTLKGNKTIYTINTDDFTSANLLRTGDKVAFKANEVDGQSIGNISSFTNKNLQ